MTSKTTVLAVVIGLTLFSLFGLVGAIVLVAIKKDVPEPLWTLVGASVGALGLAPRQHAVHDRREGEGAHLGARVRSELELEPEPDPDADPQPVRAAGRHRADGRETARMIAADAAGHPNPEDLRNAGFLFIGQYVGTEHQQFGVSRNYIDWCLSCDVGVLLIFEEWGSQFLGGYATAVEACVRMMAGWDALGAPATGASSPRSCSSTRSRTRSSATSKPCATSCAAGTTRSRCTSSPATGRSTRSTSPVRSRRR